MSSERRETIIKAYAEAAEGDSRRLGAMLSDDIVYVAHGHSAWSGVYEGKDSMLNRCIRPVWKRLGGHGRFWADRVILDGDIAAVEGHGVNRTLDGRDYNNRYCWILRFDGDKVVEMAEYLDTAMIEALGVPGEGEGPDRAAA